MLKLVNNTDYSGTSFFCSNYFWCFRFNYISENPNKEFDTEIMIDYSNDIDHKHILK